MQSISRPLEGMIFLGIVGFFTAFIASFLLILIILAASAIDLDINSPEKAAQAHIQETIQEIRELVQETMANDIPLVEDHTVHCWQENDPSHIPSGNYTVQQCRIRFESKPRGDVQATYTVLMKDEHEDLFIIFKSPNHPIADAYLDKETVRAFPKNKHTRLTNK